MFFRAVKIEDIPKYIELSVPIDSTEKPNKKNVWTFTNNIDSVDPLLPQFLNFLSDSPYDNHEFFLQLAVAAGNFYKRILGESHPAYQFGIFLNENIKQGDKVPKELPGRFSKFIDGLADFSTSTDAEVDSEINEVPNLIYINNMMVVPGTNRLLVNREKNIQKAIKGLMSVFAVCYFFDDGDFKGDNVCLLENVLSFQAIKLDPEAAFSRRFFQYDQEDISKDLKNIYLTDLFQLYPFLLLADFTNTEHYEGIVSQLFKSDEAKKEFYDTLDTIVSLSPAEIRNMLMENINPEKYQPQIDKLVETFLKRQQYFNHALKDMVNTPVSINKKTPRELKTFSITSMLNLPEKSTFKRERLEETGDSLVKAAKTDNPTSPQDTQPNTPSEESGIRHSPQPQR